jgi:hypothetical protein
MTRSLPTFLKWFGLIVLFLLLLWAVPLTISWVRLQRAYAALEKDGRPARRESTAS